MEVIARPAEPTVEERVSAPRTKLRTALTRTATALAFALTWLALVLPDRINELTPSTFVRIRSRDSPWWGSRSCCGAAPGRSRWP